MPRTAGSTRTATKRLVPSSSDASCSGVSGKTPSWLRAKENGDDLVGARIGDPGLIQRPFEDADDVVAREQADQHGDAQRRPALDEHPAKVFEVLEKGFYRPALFLLWFVKAFRYGFISHGRNRSANQDFGVGRGLRERSAAARAGGCVPLAGNDLGGGGVSSIAVEISSVTSRVAFLNSLMPEPRPLANSGSFLAPNRIRTTGENQDDFPATEVKSSKHDIHKLANNSSTS